MPSHSLSKLLCLFSFTSFFLTATCLADELPQDTLQPPVLLNAETYGVKNGLSQNTVTSFTEDNDGYMWFGTLNGLNRFDGKDFKHFYANDSNGLENSFIRSLIFTEKFGGLLIGTDSGLYTYKKDIEHFVKTDIKEKIVSMDANDKYLIISTKDSTYKLSNINTILEEKKFISNDIKKQLIIDNTIYTLCHSGILYADQREIETGITNIAKIKNNLYAINNSKSIFYIDNNKIMELTSKYDSLSGNGETISLSKGNRIFYLSKNEEIISLGKVSNNYQLNSPYIIAKVKSGFIVSNFNQGFAYINDMRNILKNTTLTENTVWSIKKNNNNQIIISDKNDNIKILNKNLKQIAEIKTNIYGEKTAIYIDDKLYVGNEDGLFCFEKNIKNKVINLPISIVTVDKYDNLIIGTTDGNIIYYDTKKEEIFKKINIDARFPIFDIKPYNDELYIATQSGAYLYSKNNLINIYDKNMVFSIGKYGNNVIIGTPASLISLSLETKNYKELYNQNKPIFSIVISENSIIASSTKEIIIIDKFEKNKILINENFGSQLEYNSQSGIIINGKVLFGGSSGITFLDIEKTLKFLKNQGEINTRFESLYLFNNLEKIGGNHLDKALDYKKKIVLKHSEYPFTVKFNSPGSGYTKIEYEYNLSGLNNDWLRTKDSDSATYTNLPYGEYKLMVYAINPLTGKRGSLKTLKIEIKPPIWLSINAKILYLATIVAILFFIVKEFFRRREIQRQIALSEERLKLSLWGSGDEMWDWDIESGKIYRSNIWGSLEFPRDGQRSGKEGEESNIHPQDQERVREALNRHFYGETDHFEATYRVRSKKGEWLWILDRAKIVERDDKDHALRMTGTIKNISSFKTAEEQLRLFERAIKNISEGVFILDTDFNFVELNEAACNITRYTKELTIGKPMVFEKYSVDYNKQIKQLLMQQGQWNTEIESIRGDGSVFLMELTIDAIYDDQGLLTHYVGVFSDISHRKQQEEELRRLTNNDLLTGLPNRSNLQVTLENLVKKDHHHTLMILDLDNFKKINDSLGHQIGDDLLCQVSTRIAGIIPKHTSLYRLGGDEFAILVDKNPDIGSSALIANDIIEAFNEPFTLSGESLVVGVSIGIVLYPEDEQNEQALLRKADIAMYHAKSAGGNRYQFYSEALNRNALRQLEVESLIREGLKDDLFEVYFQPKVNLRTGKLAGMEALVRLNHPQHGLIPPAEFIPLAEETGLIVEVGDVVLKKACFAAQKWREDGLFTGRVAVNLSSRQFALPDLQTRIESILRLTRLPANNLELEITEGTVIKQPEKAIKVMQQLTRLGISLALDDFGTGYSSLSYLKRFPIHTLKIDKAFVDDIDKSDRDLKMVDSIITIAHNMGLSVVGEGVEQAAQLNILKALNCEEIQGFIYSKAIPEHEFTEYLKLDKTISDNQLNGTN